MYSLFTDLVNISVKFSKKSEDGLRALIELTKNYGHPITRQQIGQRQNVPVVFLEQILLRLKHAGLVASTRGVQGGYALIKLPSKVTLGHVIRILDGPLAPIGSVSKTAYQKCLDCPYTTKPTTPYCMAWATRRKGPSINWVTSTA